MKPTQLKKRTKITETSNTKTGEISTTVIGTDKTPGSNIQKTNTSSSEGLKKKRVTPPLIDIDFTFRFENIDTSQGADSLSSQINSSNV